MAKLRIGGSERVAELKRSFVYSQMYPETGVARQAQCGLKAHFHNRWPVRDSAGPAGRCRPDQPKAVRGETCFCAVARVAVVTLLRVAF
jgi:hypothetical protein